VSIRNSPRKRRNRIPLHKLKQRPRNQEEAAKALAFQLAMWAPQSRQDLLPSESSSSHLQKGLMDG
jgi:hypothetical protein